MGGLGEGLFFISITLLGIIHFGALDNMVISELFRTQKDRDPSKNAITTEQQALGTARTIEQDNPESTVDNNSPRGKAEEDWQNVQAIESTSSIRQFLQFILPQGCHCCCIKMTRRERIMAKCRDKYFKEIDIIEHIMQFREVRTMIVDGATVPVGGQNPPMKSLTITD